MTDAKLTSPVRILIVDDHYVVRRGLQSLLAGQRDLQIVGEAENGSEVIPFLESHPVDLILLDIQLKGQSGLDVARKVRQAYPQIKIIVLTTFDDESLLHEALEAGVHGYLLKAVSHENMADSIRSVMGGERLLSPQLISTVMENYQQLAREQARRASGLTEDELQVLACIAEGGSNKDLSERFFWSEATVKRKIQDILEKMEASSRAQAIAEAVRRGWI